tara:strand:- start:79 stop:522 length:444 start_codon:yes stop_codon:yes gene_type:complete
MGKVIEIAISQSLKGKMESVNSIQVIAGEGIIKDRHLKKNNDKKNQITLIEIENIKYYNRVAKTLIKSIDFRRNIITEGIKLNQLLGKEFVIGEVKLKAHDLCRPCKYLQERLKQKDFIKEMLHKGGIRCEILTNGIINVGSKVANE